MTLIPLTQCSGMLSIDAKTLRQWLKHSTLSVHPHPTDARIKCLTIEQVHQLASLHDRSVTLDAGFDLEQVSSTPQLAQPETSLLPQSANPLPFLQADPELTRSLASLETTVLNLQQQVAQLALELVRERERTFEHRLSTLEALVQQIGESSESLPGPEVEASHDQPDHPAPAGRCLNPAELRARSRVIPLIEYSAEATYVVICPQEGELFFAPDSTEWFDWLACLSSFRFVSQFGRFTAYRDSRRSGPRRCWSAACFFHGRRYKCYLGVTDHLTLSVLEQAAATLQSHMAAL